MNRIKAFLGLVVLILLGVFLGQNTGAVTVQFLTFEFAVSLVVLVLIALSIGFITGYLASRTQQRRWSRRRRKKEQRNEAKQAERDQQKQPSL